MGARKRKVDDCGATPAGSSAGPTSQSKRPKNDPDVTTEKRLARYKVFCPQNIRDRVNRVLTQRFFMIERERNEGQLQEEFKVLGSTGNVYTVVIKNVPTCNCPDARKGNHCKHILFIFLKVLSVSIDSPLYYQKALLSTELEAIFTNAPVAPNSSSNPRIQAAYAKATGKAETTQPDNKDKKTEEPKRRLPEEEDNCPICYESMHDQDVETLTFCGDCGNALHMECFQQWARTATPVTCVWCRAVWGGVDDAPGAFTSGHSSATNRDEGYLNIGAEAGISPVRDTSSYYRGRYGRRWGGQPY